jgi:hypothetical protein
MADNDITVRLQKCAHNPLLTAAGLDKTAVPVPWLGGKKLYIQLGLTAKMLARKTAVGIHAGSRSHRAPLMPGVRRWRVRLSQVRRIFRVESR